MKGAGAVNAPGSWNFSELNTDDPEAARRFYGAVFGWEADEVDMGAMSGLMVRLPGYADFLEQFDPGIRQRHADFGAPPASPNASPGSCRFRRARRRIGASPSALPTPMRSPPRHAGWVGPSSSSHTTSRRFGARCCAIPVARG